MDKVFWGKVALQQRVLPAYRALFFDRLAESCRGGLEVYAGRPRRAEAILTADGLERARYHPVRNLHLFSGEVYLCFQPGLIRRLEASDPDVLVVEANPRYLSNDGAADWMRSRGKPALGWGLGAPRLRGPFAGLRRWMRARLLRRLDGLIAYSRLGAEQYREAGVAPDQVFVALNAVSPPPERIPDREPLAGRPPRVLFVGRLQVRKRVDLLLRACASLASEHKVELLIVGDGPARRSLERLAGSIYPGARFTGALQGEALERAFSDADLFVLPGTGGLAIQQAMAYGLPVIAAEGDGTERDLVTADNGWRTAPGDLAALVDAFRQALRDPIRLREKGAESHRMVSEQVNIDAMVADFVHALNVLAPER